MLSERLSLLLLFPFLFSGSETSFSLTDSNAIQLESFKAHSRLKLRIDQGVTVDWKKDSQGFTLTLKGIGLVDLGAPFGGEEKWVKQFQNLRDNLLDGLKVRETTTDVIVSGRWKFPRGKRRLAFPEMHHFDFRTKKPPTLMIDFWIKRGPTLIEHQRAERRRKRLEAQQLAETKQQQRIERRLATVKRHSEAANPEKFCDEPLSNKTDLFIEFRPVHRRFNFDPWFPKTTADANYPYLRPSGDRPDAQYVRLALKLYGQSKSGLTIRTIEFFEKEHAKSAYMQQMRFLKANALLKLGHGKKANEILRQISIQVADDPVALHAAMFIAGRAYRSGEYLTSLEHFLTLIKRYPKFQDIWVFHLGAAESLYALKQTARAAKEYQWVVENAFQRKAQAEAAFRIGDLYMERRQYAQALASYFKALREYKDQADSFSEIHLNRAEALYWLGQYDRAEKAFKKYVEKNSVRTEAWRASLRLAEIYGRKNDRKTMGKWLYKTINGYPKSPGATLARLRLMPCGDHGGFTLSSAKEFIEKDARKFNPKSEIFMKRYPSYLTVAHVRTLVVFGQEGEAVDVISKTFKKSIDKEAHQILRSMFSVVFRNQAVKLLKQNKNYEALAFYDRYAWAFSKFNNQIFSDVILQLSRLAADLKLGSFALRLVDTYHLMNRQRQKNRDVAAEKGLELGVDERMSQSEEAFTEAKAIWSAKGMESEKRVTELLNKVSDESSLAFEKQIMLGSFAEGRGNYQKALQHALKARILASASDSITLRRLKYWIATLQGRTGKFDAAVSALHQLQAEKNVGRLPSGTQKDYGLPAVPSHRDLILQEASIFEKQGLWGAVAETYSRAIEKGRLKDNRSLYSYAKALGMLGKEDDRAEILKQISKSKTNDFWKKLANETLTEN